MKLGTIVVLFGLNKEIMVRFIIVILLSLSAFAVTAQVPDSLFAVRKGPVLALKYISKNGETVTMIANRFFASQEKIESMSMVDGRKKLPAGTTLYIPMTTENYNASKDPVGITNQEEIYYRVGEKDNVALISMYSGIKKQDLILWNTLHGNTLAEGQPLFIGWLKVVPHDSINLMNGLAYPSRRRMNVPDTGRHAFGVLDSLYNVQTRNGQNVISEKGTAVFFDKAGINNVYFAFHNTTPRGAVIKVTNPGTGKTIFVKVLGPIPDTKLYANAVIGICSAAKEALGINDTKAWCELTYAP